MATFYIQYDPQNKGVQRFLLVKATWAENAKEYLITYLKKNNIPIDEAYIDKHLTYNELKVIQLGNCESEEQRTTPKLEGDFQKRIDLVRHYWFKGYITNKELFRFLEPLMYQHKDVLSDPIYLKMLIRGCFAQIKAFKNNYDKNFWLGSEVIPENLINTLWIDEFHRLKSKIDTIKHIKCDNCGKPAIAQIKLMENSIPEYDVDAGRIYWERSCNYCHKYDNKYSEVE